MTGMSLDGQAFAVTVFATCKVFAPRFVAAGSGAIVTTSSFAWKGDYGAPATRPARAR